MIIYLSVQGVSIKQVFATIYTSHSIVTQNLDWGKRGSSLFCATKSRPPPAKMHGSFSIPNANPPSLP